MSRASSLYSLQILDLKLESSRERVTEILAILEDDQDIISCRGILEKTEAKLKDARAANSRAEHVVASQRAKIEQTEKTLYGGTIRNPKELQDRQQEAESLKRYLVTLEDRLLEVMIQLDEAQQERDAASGNLARAEDIQTTQHKDLNQEREGLLESINRMDAEREAALANVDQQDLSLYEDLKQRFGGIVITLVQAGNCGACGFGVAHSVQQSIRSGSNLIRCDQCGRILYAG